MPHISTLESDRRHDRRQAVSYAFWFRRSQAEESSAAFMLNVSAGGAAFLASADQIPVVGERLQLTEMCSTPEIAMDYPAVPSFARVIRVDDAGSELRRVAVRFETPVFSRLRSARPRRRNDRLGGMGDAGAGKAAESAAASFATANAR